MNTITAMTFSEASQYSENVRVLARSIIDKGAYQVLHMLSHVQH